MYFLPAILNIFLFNAFEKLHHRFLSDDEIILIKNTGLFNNATLSQFSNILQYTTLIKYYKNQLIFKEGDLADALYIIAEGSVQVFTYDREGKRIALARLSKGDFFGEQAILSEEVKTRNASIQTFEVTTLLKIHASAIHPLWEEDKNLIKKLKKIGFDQAIHSMASINQLYGDIKNILLQIEPDKLTIVELPRDTTIFNYGDKPDNVYFILQGKVELRFPETKTMKLNRLIISQGNLFGEVGFIENKPRSAGAYTLENVRLFVIHGEQFKEIYQNYPKLQHLLSIYKKTYQLPLRGIVQQYIGTSPEVGPTITSIFKLKSEKNVIATRSVLQDIFTMSFIKSPPFMTYKYIKDPQNFVEIFVSNNYLTGIKSYGDWEDLQNACSILLDEEYIADPILEQFPSTGKLAKPTIATQEEIICSCMSVSRKQIESLISQGITDFNTISRETGAGTVCGSCRYRVLEMLGENPWMAATMKKIITHNNYNQSYFIKLIDQKFNQFQPGQHVLLQVNINNNDITRCYTMSDIQYRDGLRITIKKENDGLFTKWLFEEAPAEISLNVTQPQGAFTIDMNEKLPAICFAGGVGITPFISYAKSLAASNSNKKLHILYCASKKNDFLFVDEFSEISRSKESITITYRAGETHGRLTKNDVINLIRSMHESAVYICGPEGFVDMVNQALEEIKYDANKIHIEKFLHAGSR